MEKKIRILSSDGGGSHAGIMARALGAIYQPGIGVVFARLGITEIDRRAVADRAHRMTAELPNRLCNARRGVIGKRLPKP